MTAILFALLTATASPLLEDGSVIRLAECEDPIHAAASLAGVTPEIIAAIVYWESRVRRWQVNETTGAEGYGQIIWAWWGELLLRHGLRREDLHHPVWGILAIGIVLRDIRETYHRTGQLALCVYAVGTPALRFKRDCTYSREITALARGLR